MNSRTDSAKVNMGLGKRMTKEGHCGPKLEYSYLLSQESETIGHTTSSEAY